MRNSMISIFNHSSFQSRWIPLILFTFALILRLWKIDAHQIQLDEPFSLYHSSASLLDIFRMLPNENNPPLHFLILHLSIEIFGIEPFYTRLLSTIFSALAVVYTYFLGREFLNFRTGLAAALLMCLSNLNIIYAHEVRVYSLFTLLAISTTYYFFKMHFGLGEKKSFAFILSSLLLIYSHFFGIILLAGLFLLPFTSKSVFYTNLKKRLIAFIWIIILYTPYTIILVNRFLATSEGNWVPKPNMSHLTWGIGLFTHLGKYTYMIEFVLFVYILLSILQKGLSTKKGNLLILLFSFCYFSMFFASSYLPMFIERYLVYLSPIFYLGFVYLLSHVLKFHPFLGNLIMFLFILAMSSKLSLSYPTSRQPREVTEYIREFQAPNSASVIIPKWWELNLAYHYDIEIFKKYGSISEHLVEQRIYPIYGGSDLEQLQHHHYSQVLFIDGGAQFSDPDSTAYIWCRNQFLKDSVVAHLEGYKLTLFYEPQQE